jgi:hypothetical protein
LKNQHCAFILSVLFAAKLKRAILGAQLGLADDFPPIFSP